MGIIIWCYPLKLETFQPNSPSNFEAAFEGEPWNDASGIPKVGVLRMENLIKLIGIVYDYLPVSLTPSSLKSHRQCSHICHLRMPFSTCDIPPLMK